MLSQQNNFANLTIVGAQLTTADPFDPILVKIIVDVVEGVPIAASE